MYVFCVFALCLCLYSVFCGCTLCRPCRVFWGVEGFARSFAPRSIWSCLGWNRIQRQPGGGAAFKAPQSMLTQICLLCKPQDLRQRFDIVSDLATSDYVSFWLEDECRLFEIITRLLIFTPSNCHLWEHRFEELAYHAEATAVLCFLLIFGLISRSFVETLSKTAQRKWPTSSYWSGSGAKMPLLPLDF